MGCGLRQFRKMVGFSHIWDANCEYNFIIRIYLRLSALAIVRIDKNTRTNKLAKEFVDAAKCAVMDKWK